MLSVLELPLHHSWFLPDLRRAEVDPVADAPSLAIPSDAILPFASTKIPAVSIDALFVTGQQPRGYDDIVSVGTSHLNGVNQTGIRSSPPIPRRQTFCANCGRGTPAKVSKWSVFR